MSRIPLKSDIELKDIGQKLNEYAKKNFSVELAFKYIINVLKEKYSIKNEINNNIQIF